MFVKIRIWSLLQVIHKAHNSMSKPKLKQGQSNKASCKDSLFFSTMWSIMHYAMHSKTAISLFSFCSPLYYVPEVPKTNCYISFPSFCQNFRDSGCRKTTIFSHPWKLLHNRSQSWSKSFKLKFTATCSCLKVLRIGPVNFQLFRLPVKQNVLFVSNLCLDIGYFRCVN